MNTGALLHYRKLIIEPDEGVEPVVRLIESAKKFIRVKQFTFTHPALLNAVKAAHERGVEVRIMLNPARSSGSRANDEAFAWLQKAGIAVKWSSSRFVVTHEKSMQVDGLFALIATFNFAEKYFTLTRDYGVLIEDAALLEQVAAGFEADWNGSSFVPDATSDIIWSNVNSRRRICDLIDSASRTVEIQHPKLVDAVVLDRLASAVDRGVHVRFLCGGKHGISDYDVLDTFSSLRLLRRVGVRVHRQRNFRLHAKLVIIDREIAQTGSMNLDRSAFDLRRELGVILREPKIVQRLCEIFEHDWESSTSYHAPDPLDQELHLAEENFPHDSDLQHE